MPVWSSRSRSLLSLSSAVNDSSPDAAGGSHSALVSPLAMFVTKAERLSVPFPARRKVTLLPSGENRAAAGTPARPTWVDVTEGAIRRELLAAGVGFGEFGAVLGMSQRRGHGGITYPMLGAAAPAIQLELSAAERF